MCASHVATMTCSMTMQLERLPNKMLCSAAEKVGTAASAGGNWVWNASSRASTALKGDAITVRMWTCNLADLTGK